MVRSRIVIVSAVLALVALVAPGSALAKSEKPSVSTGGASAVAQTTATVRAAVRPNGAQTTYVFQYGTTTRYEITTPVTPVGDGGALLNVTAAIAGLAPATKYHFRVVARNRNGTTNGKDKTFTTAKQPLGLALGASATTLSIDEPVTFAGQLTGTGSAGRIVALQFKPFPYTADWVGVPGVNNVATFPDGTFAFRLDRLGFNSQFRVALPSNPAIASPIVSLAVKPRITTKVQRTVKRTGKRKRYARIRWTGTITPNRDGSQVLIQKLLRRTWVTIGTTTAGRVSDTESKFSKRIRQRHGGTYRVVVNPVDGAFAVNTGRVVHVRVRRG